MVDFLYLFLNAYLFLEYSDKRIIKALGLSLGYIAIFNLIPIGYLLIEGLTQRITEIWKDVLVYSFFTGSCLISLIIIRSLLKSEILSKLLFCIELPLGRRPNFHISSQFVLKICCRFGPTNRFMTILPRFSAYR